MAKRIFSFNRRTALRFALIATAAIFILVGGYRGEIKIVFMKAVNICLECIGIG
jgi:hypothetical protein